MHLQAGQAGILQWLPDIFSEPALGRLFINLSITINLSLNIKSAVPYSKFRRSDGR